MKKSYEFLFVVILIFSFLSCKQQLELIHEHSYNDFWSYDEEYHWHQAICDHKDEISSESHHRFSEWTIVKEVTSEENGLKEKKCKICGYNITEIISQNNDQLIITTDYSEITYDETDDHKIVTEYVNGKKFKETHYGKNNKLDFSREYDSQGNKINYIKYNTDATLNYVYDYDNNGKLTKRTYYNSENVENYVYEHDNNGNIIKYTQYDVTGERFITEYNSDGQKIKYLEFYSNGNVKIWYEYNSNGNKLKYIEYYFDGTLKLLDEYNENGKNLKYSEYNSDGYLEVLDEYNADGIKIKHTKYDAYRAYIITEYDSNEKEIKRTEYNYDGTIDRVISREYTDKYIIATIYDSLGTIVLSEEYNIQNELIKTTSFKSDGSVEFYATYEYGLSKRLTEYIKYDSTNSIICQTVYNYDTLGLSNQISYAYNSDGSVSYTEYIEYNENSSFSYHEEIYYDSTGSIKDKHLWDYDSEGILVEEIHYLTDDYLIYRYFRIENAGYIYNNYYYAEGNIWNYRTNIYNSITQETSIIYQFPDKSEEVYDYDSDYKLVGYSRYNASKVKIFSYEPKAENTFEVFLKPDGSLDYINEYSDYFDKSKWLYKYTKYNSDNSVLIEHIPTLGNYIYKVYTKSDGTVDFIEEINSVGDIVKQVYYNEDGTIKE